jgi:hypothetical protein
LDGRDLVHSALDRRDHIQTAEQLAGQQQTGMAGERGVVVPDLDVGLGGDVG